jgi:hypothetical protein
MTYDQFLTRITQGQLKYIANGHELNITSGKLMLDLSQAIGVFNSNQH